jgi:hypothetical protein
MNKRMTKRDTDGQAMMDCQKCKADWTGKYGKPMADCTAMYCRNRVKDRLAEYEDTGLTPEEVLPKDKADEIALKLMRLADLESLCNYTRLRELAEADKDGRLLVPPCKVGDVLYRASPSGVVVHRVANVMYRGLTSRWYIDTIPNLPYASEELGKTTFLTHEEAEKALKEVGQK